MRDREPPDLVEELVVEPEEGGDDVVLGTDRRRWVPLVGAVAVAAGLVAAVLVIGRDDVVERTVPSTSIRPTTAASAPRPTTTIRRPPRSTTSTTVGVLPGTGPVFGGPTGGTSAVGIGQHSELVRVDLDTGTVTLRPLPQVADPTFRLVAIPRSDGTLLVDSFGEFASLWAPDDPAQPLRRLPDDVRIATFAAADPALVWAIDDLDGRARARLLRADDGTEAAEAEVLPPGTRPVADDGTGQLLVEGPDLAAGRYDPATDRVTRLPVWRPFAWSSSQVVGITCDADATCGQAVADSSGVRRVADLPRELLLPYGQTQPVAVGAVSPDGRWLVRPVEGCGGVCLEVTDLVGDERRSLGGAAAESGYWMFRDRPPGGWTLDGAAFVFTGIDGELSAWYPPDGAVRRVGTAVPVLRTVAVG